MATNFKDFLTCCFVSFLQYMRRVIKELIAPRQIIHSTLTLKFIQIWTALELAILFS